MSITASPDIELSDIDTASSLIADQAHEDATVIWGVAFDPELEDKMKITIIATGFDNSSEKIVMRRGDTDVKRAEAPAADAPKAEVETEPEEMPEVGESNVSDDDITEIINMLRKNKEAGK